MDNRQIDALVAEKVMGLRVTKRAGLYGIAYIDQTALDAAQRRNDERRARGERLISFVAPHIDYYSADIEAAWRVVERMQDRVGKDVVCRVPSVSRTWHAALCG